MVIFVVPPVSDTGPSSSVAIIPARYHSTRLPGKALADIAGKPMIEHVYRRAAAAASVSRVIVATDDRRIFDAVERFGGEARMTSASHESGTDRLAEVAASIECDLIVNVQGDEPLLASAVIDEAVAPFAGHARARDEHAAPYDRRCGRARKSRTSRKSSWTLTGSPCISRARRFPTRAPDSRPQAPGRTSAFTSTAARRCCASRHSASNRA